MENIYTSEEEVMEMQEKQLKEIKKKSEFTAGSWYAYKKLEAAIPGLIPCRLEEQGEDIELIYDLQGLREYGHLKQESPENQYQFLINFQKLEAVTERYKLNFHTTQMYYDENYLPCVKERDIYPAGENGGEAFLYAYKSYAGGVLHKKYETDQIAEAGLELLRQHKVLQKICQCETSREIVELLQGEKLRLLQERQDTEMVVNKKKYKAARIVSGASIVILAAICLYTGYQALFVQPVQKIVIEASQAYVSQDYVATIESLKSMDLEQQDKMTKYMLAVSYIQTETFKKEEVQSILAKVSPSSDEREFDYWIYLGKLNFEEAEDIAVAMSDDKLLIYAYMKEYSMLETDTTISGSEKKERMAQLESEIENLGAKYEQQEDE